MKNSVQNGNTLTIAAGATITSGNAYLIGKVLGVATKSVASGEDVALSVCGVYELPKASGAITQGAIVYWDDTAKNITTTSSANTQCGYAWAAAQSGDATAIIKLGI